MSEVPRLADVQCSRIQFQPGDRIMVQVYQRLTPAEMARLRKTVERWAGNCVEVLVVDRTQIELTIERAADGRSAYG